VIKGGVLAAAWAWTALALTGCGGGDGEHSGPPAIVTQILSDPAFDGDIEQTSSATFTITQGMSPTVQSVLAGIDPVSATEFRAFLDFPLGGADGVPADAFIDSAFLEIYVDDLELPGSSLPVLVDLVAFQPPTLLATDFDRTAQPALASTRISPPISRSDVGTYVSIDVTSLMNQAQRLSLNDFQVRIMEEVGPPIASLMVIDDTTGASRSARAPLLTVTYR
jgi:hypothetical protein